MAVVYLAYDLRLARKVAIKAMLPSHLLSEGMAERFVLEARMAARLSHPNVVVIYSISNTDDLFYFVMNLVEGAALDDIVRDAGVLPVDEACSVLSQAARALYYAHTEGVVHRDVKPANIMVNVRGDAVLTDFGIAKATESPSLTRTGSAVGTPAYMSPEQVMARELSGASDQYSLGVVAYELLSGSAPFHGLTHEVQWSHVHRTPVDLRSVAPRVPKSLAKGVMRMLAKNPAERFESLEDALEIFAEGLDARGKGARQALSERARTAQRSRAVGMPTTPQSPIPAPSAFHTAASAPSESSTQAASLPDLALQTAELDRPYLLDVGQSVTLTLELRQGGESISFATSDARVVEVSGDGVVRAVGPGSASVTVMIGNESTIIQFRCFGGEVTHAVTADSRVELRPDEPEVGQHNPIETVDILDTANQSTRVVEQSVASKTLSPTGAVATTASPSSSRTTIRVTAVLVLVSVVAFFMARSRRAPSAASSVSVAQPIVESTARTTAQPESVRVASGSAPTSAGPRQTLLKVRIDNVAVTSRIAMTVGQVSALATIVSGGAAGESVVVRSSNPRVISVDAGGSAIRAREAGSAELIATVGGVEQRVAIRVAAAADVASAKVSEAPPPPTAKPVVPSAPSTTPAPQASSPNVNTPLTAPVSAAAAAPVKTEPPTALALPPKSVEPLPAEKKAEIPSPAPSAEGFENVFGTWLSYFNGNPAEFAKRVAPSNRELSALLNRDVRDFRRDGAFKVVQVLEPAGSTRRAILTFPSENALGFPTLTTITIELAIVNGEITGAKLVSGINSKRR
jgi:serine/threonine-protein kinase